MAEVTCKCVLVTKLGNRAIPRAATVSGVFYARLPKLPHFSMFFYKRKKYVNVYIYFSQRKKCW